MPKCRGGEEPGPPEVSASPCRSAGSLPLAGRRLGGEKARRREQERGAEGLEGGVEEGGQQAGEGGLKQRAANQPGGIPSSVIQGAGEESEGLPASCLSLTVLSPRCLPPSCPLAAGGHYRMLLFSVRRGRRRQEPLAGAVPGSAHYPTAWQEGMPREWWKLARCCAQGMPTWPELCCPDEASALYWWGSPDTCLRPGKT